MAYTRVVIRIALSSVALLALVIAPPPVINNSSTLTAAQTAAFRHFVGYGVLCLLPYLLDVAWMIWSPKRQTLHDLAAGTVVVRSEVEVRAPALPPLRP